MVPVTSLMLRFTAMGRNYAQSNRIPSPQPAAPKPCSQSGVGLGDFPLSDGVSPTAAHPNPAAAHCESPGEAAHLPAAHDIVFHPCVSRKASTSLAQHLLCVQCSYPPKNKEICIFSKKKPTDQYLTLSPVNRLVKQAASRINR